VLYDVSINGKVHRVEVKLVDQPWECVLDGLHISVDAVEVEPGTLSLLIDGKSFEARCESASLIFINGKRYEVSVDDPRSWRGRKRTGVGTEGPQNLAASMPGKIVRVLASEGQTISTGQAIAVIEAMKMQNEIKSPKAGTLKRLLVQPGFNVNAGEVLAIVE
jgi:biotin carboxyl carrier protein